MIADNDIDIFFFSLSVSIQTKINNFKTSSPLALPKGAISTTEYYKVSIVNVLKALQDGSYAVKFKISNNFV